MEKYHKINTIFKRDNKGRIIENDFSLPEFEFLKENTWVFTEKIDGTNIRVIWEGDNITFSGKTDNAQIPSFLINRLNELFFNPERKQLFKDIFGENNVCLYGEGYGNKIQAAGKNYIPDGVDFVLFDVKIGNVWLERENVEDIAKKFDIKVVPVIGEGTLEEMIEIVRKGFKSQWGEFLAEGIVARPKTELMTRKGERIITKLKYIDFITGKENKNR